MILNRSIEINFEDLSPIFNHEIKIGLEGHGRIYDIIVPLLNSLRQTFLPVKGVYLVGSSLTHLFARPSVNSFLKKNPSQESLLIDGNSSCLLEREGILIEESKVDCSDRSNSDSDNDNDSDYNDYDLKIVVEGTQQIAGQIFLSFQQLPLLVIEGEVKTLGELSHDTFPYVSIPEHYCFKAFTFKKHGEGRPFEISIIVKELLSTDPMSIFPPSVMNIDSLFVPITLFHTSSYDKLGTDRADQFQIFSTQGHCDFVIENIRNRLLTCLNPASIYKHGWPRYLMAVTNGFVCEDGEVNRIFCETDMKDLQRCLFDLYKFIQKKKQPIFQVYWPFFLCNAIFHCPQGDAKEKLHELFKSLLEHRTHQLPWMSFFKEMVPTSFPAEDVSALLNFFIPLIIPSNGLKSHMGENWLQSVFEFENKKFYFLLPPTMEDEIKSFPSSVAKIALKAIGSERININNLSFETLLVILDRFSSSNEEKMLSREISLGIKECLKIVGAKKNQGTNKNNPLARSGTILINIAEKIERIHEKHAKMNPIIGEMSLSLVQLFLKGRKQIYLNSAKRLLLKIHHERIKNEMNENVIIDVEAYCQFLEKSAKDSQPSPEIYDQFSFLLSEIQNKSKEEIIVKRLSETLIVLCERKFSIQCARPLIDLGLELIRQQSYGLTPHLKMIEKKNLMRFLLFVIEHSEPDSFYYFFILKKFFVILQKTSHLIDPSIFEAFLIKGLEVAEGSRVTVPSVSVACLLGNSYKYCSEYFEEVPSINVKREIVLRAARCFFSFSDREQVWVEFRELLNQLIIQGTLEEKFISDMAREFAMMTHVSPADVYINLFQDPLLISPSSPNTLLKIIACININDWDTEGVDRFFKVFLGVCDQFFITVDHQSDSNEFLRSFFLLYLKLMIRCSQPYLSIAIFDKIVADPKLFFIQDGRENDILEFLKLIAMKVDAFGYVRDDIERGTVVLFRERYTKLWKNLSPIEKVNYRSTFTTLINVWGVVLRDVKNFF